MNADRLTLDDFTLKWERIVLGVGEDSGSENCPLCRRFYYSSAPWCLSCPVHNFTGMRQCVGTPLEGFEGAFDDYAARWDIYGGGADDVESLRLAAWKELRFLVRVWRKYEEGEL